MSQAVKTAAYRDCATNQAADTLLCTAAARVLSQCSPHGLCCGHVTAGQALLEYSGFPLSAIIS